MRISTIWYALKQGMKNIYRNRMFSLASVATMSACIFLFGMFFSIVMNFDHAVKKAEQGVAVTVFFTEGLDDDGIEEIGEEIKKRVEVSRVVFVSAEEAWEEYQSEYFGDNAELAEGFKEDNPLADSAHYEIYLSDVSMQDALVTYLESLEGVRQVNHSEIIAKTLTSFNSLFGYIAVAIILVLLGVSIFLISNTVTIGISVRKEEIAIMKLIGATDFFVRAPFIVEGVIIGIIGSALPLVIIHVIYSRVVGFVANKFSVLSIEFIQVEKVFKYLVPMSLLIGLGVGLLGSIYTIRKHLKV